MDLYCLFNVTYALSMLINILIESWIFSIIKLLQLYLFVETITYSITIQKYHHCFLNKYFYSTKTSYV